MRWAVVGLVAALYCTAFLAAWLAAKWREEIRYSEGLEEDLEELRELRFDANLRARWQD